jgi:hypothetical protein
MNIEPIEGVAVGLASFTVFQLAKQLKIILIFKTLVAKQTFPSNQLKISLNSINNNNNY